MWAYRDMSYDCQGTDRALTVLETNRKYAGVRTPVALRKKGGLGAVA